MQDGTVNVDKMTNEQKNSYLEAHMEVQQHMHHVSMQLNKHPQPQSAGPSLGQNNMNGMNMGLNSSNQTSAGGNLNHPYLGSNSIKVWLVRFSFLCICHNHTERN